jgi:formate dehydrogenase subunit delta
MSGHGTAEHLVTMANDIANYFHSETDREVAVDGIVGHITRFWEPRMRRKILAHYAQNNGEGLNDLAHAAIEKLARAADAAAA